MYTIKFDRDAGKWVVIDPSGDWVCDCRSKEIAVEIARLLQCG